MAAHAVALTALAMWTPPPPNGSAWNRTCAVQDAYHCVAIAGCGFCMTSYTCMRGDADGPAEGSLPCPHGRIPADCLADHKNQSTALAPAWAYDEARLNASHGCVHRLRPDDSKGWPSTTPGPSNAPPEWDASVCINGGQRHWEVCNADPANPRKCLSHQDVADQTWGAQRCDCPDGLGGLDCGACIEDGGCYSPLLGLPELNASLEEYTCAQTLGYQHQPSAMTCTIEDTWPSLWAPIINQFANGTTVGVTLAADGSGEMVISLPVEYPAWAGHWYNGDVDDVHYDRLLSGVPVRVRLPAGAALPDSPSTCSEQQDKSVKNPWGTGDDCATWHIEGKPEHICPYPHNESPCPPDRNISGCEPEVCVAGLAPTGCFRHNSFTRYETCGMLSGVFSPPFTLECQYGRSIHAGHAGCKLTTSSDPLVIEFAMDCQVHGECTTKQTPQPPPAKPPPPPFCRWALGLDADGCTDYYTYMRLAVPLALALLLPILIKVGGCLARCSAKRRAAAEVAAKRHAACADTTTLLARPTNSTLSVSDEANQRARATTPAADNGAPATPSAHTRREIADFSPAPPPSASQAKVHSLLALRGRLQLEYAEALADPLALSWSALAYTAGDTAVLRPSSGAVSSGLWCLLGPSGAGKSSLLGVLAGRKARGRARGHVLLGGVPAPSSTRQRLVGYVTQDDVLPPASTVAEHLSFHAATRTSWLPPKVRAELVQATMHALQLSGKAGCTMGDAYMRGLSGGERRRVSVGAELLVALAGGTSVLLADEPLSGLDSFNADLVLEALHQLAPDAADVGHGAPNGVGAANGAAHSGGPSGARPASPHLEPAPCGGPKSALLLDRARRSPTILLSVHQPTHSCLRRMAGYVVMAPGGRLVYCGPSATPGGGCALTAAFDAALRPSAISLGDFSPNAAEALLELMADASDGVTAALDSLAASTAEQHASVGAGSRRPSAGWQTALAEMPRGVCGRALAPRAGFAAQFAALSRRNLTLVFRHPLLICVNLLATIAISALCAATFWRMGDANRDGSIDFDKGVLQRIGLFAFLGIFFLLSALADLPVWQAERLLFFQEKGAGCYATLPYLASKTIFAALPLRVFPSLLCAAIVYPTTGLRHDDKGPTGPTSASMFAAGLCLLNLAGSGTFNCLGIVCPSSAIATLVGVLLALYVMLFCGLLVNGPALAQHDMQELQYTSFLYYFIELALVNELVGTTVKITPRSDQMKHEQVQTVPGDEILAQLGYAIEADVGYRDLNMLGGWVAASLVLSYVLLRFCIKDPH